MGSWIQALLEGRFSLKLNGISLCCPSDAVELSICVIVELLYLLGYKMKVLERCCSWLVRAARLECRKLQEGCEFKAGLRCLMTGKLSL